MEDINIQKLFLQFEGHTSLVQSANFSEDGKYIVSGSLNGEINFWDLKTQKQSFQLKKLNNVESLCFTPDGKQLLIGDTYGELQIWDLQQKKLIKEMTIHKTHIKNIIFLQKDKNFKFFTCSEDKLIKLWDFASLQLIQEFKGHRDYVYQICLSICETFFISASRDDSIGIWQIDPQQKSKNNFLKGHNNPVTCVIITPDNLKIISGSSDQTVRLWNIIQQKQEKVLHTFDDNKDYKIQCLCLEENGNILYIGFKYSDIVVLDIRTDQIIKKFKAHKSYLSVIALSRDQKYLLSASYDNLVRVWETESLLNVQQIIASNEQIQNNDIKQLTSFNKEQIENLQKQQQDILNENLALKKQVEDLTLLIKKQDIDKKQTESLVAQLQQEIQQLQYENQQQKLLIQQNLQQNEQQTIQIHKKKSDNKVLLLNKRLINEQEENYLAKGGQASIFQVEHSGEKIAEKIYKINLSNLSKEDLAIQFKGLIDELNMMQFITEESQKKNVNIIKLRSVALDVIKTVNQHKILKVALFQDLMKSDLKEFLQSQEGIKLKFEDKQKIMLQVCRALKFLQDNGIIHCDVKSQNVLMDFQTNAYISDLGSIHKVNISVSALSFTRAYAPLELFDFIPHKKTDTYSFGAIIQEVFTGVRPFDGEDEIKIEYNLRQGKSFYHFFIDSGNNYKSQELQNIVKGCAEIQAEQRLSLDIVENLLTNMKQF